MSPSPGSFNRRMPGGMDSSSFAVNLEHSPKGRPLGMRMQLNQALLFSWMFIAGHCIS